MRSATARPSCATARPSVSSTWATGAEEEIVELMLGPAGEDEAAIHERVVSTPEDQEPATVPSTPRLRIRGLKGGRNLHDVSFDLHAGEVLGLVALEGQGQDELFAILSGAQRPGDGVVEIDGTESSLSHPADAIAAGLVLVPGDRAEGLLMQRSVRENIALPYTAAPRKWGPIAMSRERHRVEMAIERLQIDTRAQGKSGSSPEATSRR